MSGPYVDRLRALDLFAGVPSPLLAMVMPEMEANLFDGDFAVRQGDQPRFLYLVLEGIVDVFAGPTAESRVYIDSRGPCDVIGEQAFIEKKDHSADVRARGAAKLLKIPAIVVEALLADPVFTYNLLKAVSAKLRGATSQRYKVLAQRQLLFAHFRSHVNPQLVDALLNQGEAYGQPRRIDEAFIMFSDLRDFTQLSGSMDVFDIATELAPYFGALVNGVHESSGIVDKYIGDAVMAVWGHPALGRVAADHVMDACLKMIAAVDALAFGGARIRIGIGLNAGPVFMGNIGTEEKRSFTVLGDAVNFASRYESANKADSGEVFTLTVGPAMYALLSQPHRDMLFARPDTKIKGAPGGVQTVYSLKEK